MTYALLLWPQSNQRYEEGLIEPVVAELQTILSATGVAAQTEVAEISGAKAVLLETDALTDRQINEITTHSHTYLFGIWRDGKLFEPLAGAADAYVGKDLAAIQKYKGKTNERFTSSLINMALYSCRFHDSDTRISLLDPMCGRGTTLFQAANRGFDATGLDVDKAAISELNKYFEKYLQYKKFKHKLARKSLTIKDEKPISVSQFTYTRDKDSAAGTLEVGCCEARLTKKAFGSEKFHIICCDLPYGVQHAPSGKGGADSFERMLRQTLPPLAESLKKGGAMALSYNTHTLGTDKVRLIASESGLTPLTGGAYERMEHWVEQAVNRDITVCVRD